MTTMRYRVRKQSSGRAFSETFYVYDSARGGRVSVGPLSREQAQAQADDLNIGDMVKPHAEDCRPYAVRRAEAEVAYREAQG